jgi:hypothetical protein
MKSPASIVEAIAKFDVEFARVVPVEAAEGEAIVILDAAIRNVQRGQRRGEAFAEILAERKIELPG